MTTPEYAAAGGYEDAGADYEEALTDPGETKSEDQGDAEKEEWAKHRESAFKTGDDSPTPSEGELGDAPPTPTDTPPGQDTQSETNDDQKTTHRDKDTTHVAHHLTKTAPGDVPDVPPYPDDEGTIYTDPGEGTIYTDPAEGTIIYSEDDPNELTDDLDTDDTGDIKSDATDRDALEQTLKLQEQLRQLRALTETEKQAEAKDVQSVIGLVSPSKQER